MGIAGVIRRPEEATREEAENARQASLMHEFITDLPDGYDTRLGNGGAVEGEALLHMEELGNYTLKYLARRRTRKPPHDLVTGQTPDYMLSN